MKTPNADLVEHKFYREHFDNPLDSERLYYGVLKINYDLVGKCIDDFVSAFLEDFKEENLEEEQIIPHIRSWFDAKCCFTSNYKNMIEKRVVERFQEVGLPDGMPVSPNPFENKKSQEPNSKKKNTGSGCFKAFLNPFLEQLGKLSAWGIIVVLVIVVLLLVIIFWPNGFEYLEKVRAFFR